MTVTIPADVGYGRITGQIIQAILDTPSDPDSNPDGIPAVGDITFTATLTSPAAHDTPNMLIMPGPFTVPLDEFGAIDVYLVATNDPDLNPSGWGYVVTFNIINMNIPPVTIAVPEGSTQDLISLIPAGDVNGVLTLRGPAGLNWRGNWDAGIQYEVYDAVYYLGSSWRRIVAGTTATTPDVDAVNWAPVALAGSNLTLAQQDARYVMLTGNQTIGGTKTFNGTLVAEGGNPLLLKPGTGDQTYMSFFARTASPSTRSGWLGYGSVGGNDLSLKNELAGNIVIMPVAGNQINLSAGSAGLVTSQSPMTVTGVLTVNNDILSGSSKAFIASNTGSGAPTFTTRSAGTKFVAYSGINATNAEYALGIEGGAMWLSVAAVANSFKWYGGTTLAATLTGAGAFTAVGSMNVNAGAGYSSQLLDNTLSFSRNSANYLNASTAGGYIRVTGTVTTSGDTQIAQFAVGASSVTGTFTASGDVSSSGGAFRTQSLAAVGSVAYSASVTGDTTFRHVMFADGRIEWGPGAAVSRDTFMFRSGVAALSLTGSFTASGVITAGGTGFSGPGANITGLNATNIGSGTVPDARLPARIGTAALSITDWNTVTENGWYTGASTANGPTVNGYMGTVERSGIFITQTVYRFSADGSADTMLYRRDSADTGATWTAWYRLRWSEAELDARYAPVVLLDANLPTRLRATTVTVASPDDAVENGWYRVSGPNASLPDPTNTYTILAENAGTTAYVTQTAYPHGVDAASDTRVWRRSRDNSVWGAWYRLRWSEAELDARYQPVQSDSGWVALTLLNSWVNYGSPHATAGYRKIGNRVQVKGLLKDGTVTNGTQVASLPVGYRPTEQLHFPVATNGGTAVLTITSGGGVTIAGAGVSNVNLSLSNISFMVD